MHTQQLLQAIYPTIRWDKVRMYEGLPWFVAAWTSALVLPNIWRHRTVHIYFRKIETDSVRGLSILVHECFHVLQYQDLQKMYEIGMFRNFLVQYIAHYMAGFWQHIWQHNMENAMRKAYFCHPMEVPAYQQDSLMTIATTRFAVHHKSLDLLKDSHFLVEFMMKNKDLVKYSSGILNEKQNFYANIISMLICSMLFFINPFLEILLKIIFYFYFIFSKKKHSFVL